MSTFVVTGGAGFIGSAVARSLVDAGGDVLVVDDPAVASEREALFTLPVRDLLAPSQLLEGSAAASVDLRDVEAVIHQGAISSTLHDDVDELYRNNLWYSRRLLELCLDAGTPLVYASSAAVYGRSPRFREVPGDEAPLNDYGWSKLLFDQVVRSVMPTARSQVVGLRYFNVYGPGEAHKGNMASMVHQLDSQLRSTGVARLFGASHGCDAGEQRRDFVHVDDVVSVVRWFLEHRTRSGIFNVGTGRSWSFNELAARLLLRHPQGRVEYVEVPEQVRAAYQPFTQADLGRLRSVGFRAGFQPLEEGIDRLLERRDADLIG